MRALRYFLSEVGFNIRQYRATVAVTVVTVAFTMLLFGIFLLLYVNLSAAVAALQSGTRLILYLRDGLDADGVEALQTAVRNEAPGLELVYISKDEAAEAFRRAMEGNELLLKGLSDNPLPASIELLLDQRSAQSEPLRQLAYRLARLDGVVDVQYGREWIDTLSGWVGLVEYMGWLYGGILGLAALVIVANAIRLTVFTRMEDIQILRLIGATRRFIEFPYILEGAAVGLLGSAIALGLLWGLFSAARTEVLPGGLSGQGLIFLPPLWAAIYGASGGVVGYLGSLVSLRRLQVR